MAVLYGLLGKQVYVRTVYYSSISEYLHFSMLKKKKILHSSHSKSHQSRKTLPLSRLEEISQLEKELVNILGPKNIEVDPDGNLFERLEEIYIRHLQSQSIGMEVLEKIIWLMGEADAPAKIKMIYLYAHENFLQGENPIPILQEGFNSSLQLAHKVVAGYRCGLVLAQLSQCSKLVESTLNSLVVSLEEEIGFQPLGLKHFHKDNIKNSSDQLKSVYIGRISQKSKSKFSIDYNKLQRIDLGKCLYETYLVGSLRLQSEAKRRYYRDCLEEFGRRLIRQNPGVNIKQKLQNIDSGSTAAQEFSKKTVCLPSSILNKRKQIFNRTDPVKGWGGEGKKEMGHTKTFSQVQPQQKISSCTVSPLHFSRKENSGSSEHRFSNFKIQLKPNRQKSRPITSKSSSRHKKTLGTFQVQKQNVKDTSSSREEQQKQKNIILKFDRLQQKTQEVKPEIRKRKIKRESQHWQQIKNQSMVGNVVNLSIIPSVREEPSRQIACQTSSKEIDPKQSCKDVEQKAVMDSLMVIGDDVSPLRIDNMLREGVEWIDQVLINEKVLGEEITEEIENKSQNQIKEAVKYVRDSKLQLPQCDEGLKGLRDSLKLAPHQLLISQSPSESIIGSERSNNIDESFTESCKVKSKRSYSIKESLSDSGSIEYKIVINNFEEDNQKQAEPELLKQIIKNESINTKIFIIEEVSIFMEQIKEEVAEKFSKRKIKESVGVKFDDKALETAFQEESHQEEYSYHKIAGSNNEEVRFKKIQTIKTEEQSYSFSIQEGLLNFTIKDQTIEEGKETVKSLTVSLADQYVTSMFDDLVLELVPQSTTSKIYSNQSNRGSGDFSYLSSKSSQKSLSEPRNHARSSISERLFEDDEIANKFDPIQECVNSEVDDSDLSSSIHSDNAESETPYSPISKSAGRRQRNSNFTCSRFAGSKIEENSINCVSNLNIIQELIKTIENTQGRISDRQMIHGETLQAGVRSRVHSQKSSKSNKNNLSELGDRSLLHVDVSIESYINQDLPQKIIRFDHWLSPVLKINPERISLTIKPSSSPEKEAQRQQEVPELLKTQIDKLTTLQEQILWFLDKFPKQQTSWERVLQQFQKIQLLPEKVELLTVLVPREHSDDLVKVLFEYSTSSRQLIGKSIEANLKTHPISLKLNGDLASLLSKLTPKNILVKEKDMILCTIWTVVGKRNIKLRDKSQNETINCSFQVSECYLPSESAYFYEVKDLQGETMSFGHISEALRKKVIANIDMIIGFAIKLIGKKITFTPENISNLIKLL